ncbi:MAG: hypothetical protein LBN39_04435 [Planctomycetaceae bacterium]|jgi:ABC-type Na+ efflux pump permease subunit|nr:hypothetical protein [Planctomycetaceae bacterium]
MYAILYKEYRQYTALLAAMLMLCLFAQCGAFFVTFFGYPQPALYFVIAVFITVMYAGAAAAVSFAAEHDDQTFSFLRRLPVSVKDIMFGKSAWIAVSTVLMLTGSLALTAVWQLINFTRVDFGDAALWGIFGTGIVEASAWGLFWSPRCRSMIHTLLLTYLCASLESYAAAAVFANHSTQIQEAYLRAVPLRLVICAVLALFAVRGMRRWFNVERQNHLIHRKGKGSSAIKSSLTFPYFPVKSPFFSLTFHCIRQSRAVLLSNMALSVILGIYWANNIRTEPLLQNLLLNLDKTFLFLFAVCYYLFYCGSIFAPDQKNGSYRLLSRLGVSPSKVWFSRILPFAAVAAIPLVMFFSIYGPGNVFSLYSVRNDWELSDYFRYTSFMIPFITACWLIPFAAGTFMSISLSNQIVAVALTAAGSVLLFAWMLFGIMFCGFNPLWTTMPLCIMLIFASYLRTIGWLREYSTWRNRFRILVPFFCTSAVILAAVPPVRIYSIPFVPLSEIEKMFAEVNMPEQLSVEKRHKLFEQTAASLNKPFQQSEWQNGSIWGFDTSEVQIIIHGQLIDDAPNTPLNRAKREWKIPLFSPLERAKRRTGIIKDGMKRQLDFETSLLQDYANRYRLAKSATMPSEKRLRAEFTFRLRMFQFLPWERQRTMRRLNRKLLSDVLAGYALRQGVDMFQAGIDSRYYQDNKAKIDGDPLLRQLYELSPSYGWKGSGIVFDDVLWGWFTDHCYYFNSQSQLRLHLVRSALNWYYQEHNETLPKTLDELVSGGYLDAIPACPVTGKAMRYEPVADEKVIAAKKDKRFSSYIHKDGWQYITFTDRPFYYRWLDLDFLPGYEEYGGQDSVVH